MTDSGFYSKLEDSCRGCLKPSKRHHLFGQDNLHEKYEYCTQLQISRDDGLSSYLCELCFSHLEVAYNFKKMCQETLEVMKSLQEEGIGETDKEKAEENLSLCFICHKRFSCSQSLKNHINHTHIGIKKFSCEICDRRFTQKHSLQTHLMRHTNEKPFQCDFCGRNFRRKQVLEAHLNCHTGETPYKCEKCGKSFRSRTVLRNHGHNLNCYICGKIFRMIPSLQAHIQRHKIMGEEKSQQMKVENICDECGKSFRCKSVLEAHKVLHTGEKPFKCEKCSKSFPLRASLIVHVKKKHCL